eukprot:2274516-Prymnesium_polylepis.1
MRNCFPASWPCKRAQNRSDHAHAQMHAVTAPAPRLVAQWGASRASQSMLSKCWRAERPVFPAASLRRLQEPTWLPSSPPPSFRPKSASL